MTPWDDDSRFKAEDRKEELPGLAGGDAPGSTVGSLLVAAEVALFDAVSVCDALLEENLEPILLIQELRRLCESGVDPGVCAPLVLELSLPIRGGLLLALALNEDVVEGGVAGGVSIVEGGGWGTSFDGGGPSG